MTEYEKMIEHSKTSSEKLDTVDHPMYMFSLHIQKNWENGLLVLLPTNVQNTKEKRIVKSLYLTFPCEDQNDMWPL